MSDSYLGFLNCPSCGEVIRTVGNSFFGVGLSTHRYLRVCSDCYWTEFVRTAYTQPIPVPPEEPSRWARFLQALFGAPYIPGRQS